MKTIECKITPKGLINLIKEMRRKGHNPFGKIEANFGKMKIILNEKDVEFNFEESK